MMVVDLSGKSHAWKFHNYLVKNEPAHWSKLQIEVLRVIRRLYSGDSVCGEVPLPGTSLRVDIYLPSRKLAIEANGAQHYKLVSMFHKSKQEFNQGLQRDSIKERWLGINGIDLLVLPYNESPEEWTQRINEYRTNPKNP